MATTTLDFKAQRVDLEVVRGDDIVFTLAFTDDNAVAIDISTWELSAQLRPTKDDGGDPISDFVCSIISGPAGTVQISMGADVTADLDGVYTWDLQRVANTATRTLLGGLVRVKADVTR